MRKDSIFCPSGRTSSYLTRGRALRKFLIQVPTHAKLFPFYFLIFTFNLCAQKLKSTVTENGDTLFSSNDQKIFTKPGAPRSVGDYVKTSLYKNGLHGKPILQFEIQTGRTSAFTINSGAEVQISLKDGNIVKLYCRRDTESKISRLDYGCYIFAFYSIDPVSKTMLMNSDLSSITVMSSLGKMNYEIKEKFGDAIRKELEKGF